MSANIKNEYMIAPCQEKHWKRAVPASGSDQGSLMITRKEIYGLKSSGAAFRDYFVGWLDKIGFKYLMDDPDVWL